MHELVNCVLDYLEHYLVSFIRFEVGNYSIMMASSFSIIFLTCKYLNQAHLWRKIQVI